MNNDLISREALKEVIKANHYLLSAKHNSTDYGMFTTGIIEAIDSAPTVEPEITNDDLQAAMTESYHLGYELAETKFKRPHGEWIYHEDWKNEGGCGYECSCCGRTYDYDMNFCGYCGADMRGEVDGK